MQRRSGVAWAGVALMAAAALAIVAVGVVLVLGSRDDDPQAPAMPPPAPAPPAVTTTAPPADPYEVYLQLAPPGEPTISREDAQTRALLGCGQQWAPGTVDAALAQAYGHLCP